MKYHWKDSTLRQITQLVESALAPLVDTRVAVQAPDKPATHPAWPLLRLRDEKGKATTLVVLPWAEAAKRPQDHPPLWVLQKAAKRVHEELRLRDENFVDTSGAVRLHLPGILVDRSDLKPLAVRGAPEVRNPYSDKNSLLARSLLTSSSHTWLSLQQLAGLVGIPLSSASYVIKALERSGFVGTKRTPSGLEVTLLDPLGLIADWTRQYDWNRNPVVTFAAPVGSPERFLDRLTKAMKEHRWALTLQAGASLLAPHAIWDHVHFYVDTDSRNGLLEMGKSLGWEPSPTGKVTVMMPYYRKSLWGGVRQVKGKPVVSTLQLVLDLWHYPVRGREQAEHLLDVVGLGAS